MVALTGNNPANHFLGEAITVGLSGVDQRQAERDPDAHRLFLGLDRMSHLAQMPRALPKRRNDGVMFLTLPTCGLTGQATISSDR